MNKKVLVGSIASLVLAAIPVLSSFAATTQTDTLTVTVSAACQLSRASTAHNNGATRGTWSGDTLSVTMGVATVDYNVGKSNFNVVCNNLTGYKVTVTTKDLAHTTQSGAKIPAYTGASSGAGSAYTASQAGWSPIADTGSTPTASTTKYKSGDTVKTSSTYTSGTAFSVYYGVGIGATQVAGTYTVSDAAVYTCTML